MNEYDIVCDRKEMFMNEQRITIVADSSCDLSSLADVPYAVAPLKIITADKEYVDDDALDVLGMVNDMQSYKGKSSTSCPNPSDWLATFGDADRIVCVTITGTLSGSYNAALIAKQTYEETYPDRRVFVINTLTAGPEIALVIEKLRELILAGRDFDNVCEDITQYMQTTGLLFMLESMKNLANNGRVNSLVARMAGVLGIRVVGKASDKGDLEPLHKCRGEAKALAVIVEELKAAGVQHGRVNIAHCFNEEAGKRLAALITAQMPDVRVRLYSCGGLCSFYAEEGGLLVGFEAE